MHEEDMECAIAWRWFTEGGTNKRSVCYACKGVLDDFPFNPVARKEVSISLQDSTSLKTFAVLSFIRQLLSYVRILMWNMLLYANIRATFTFGALFDSISAVFF